MGQDDDGCFRVAVVREPGHPRGDAKPLELREHLGRCEQAERGHAVLVTEFHHGLRAVLAGMDERNAVLERRSLKHRRQLRRELRRVVQLGVRERAGREQIGDIFRRLGGLRCLRRRP